MEIGERLKQSRDRAGETVKGLGQKLGDAGADPLSPTSIHNYESGRTIPSVPTLLAYCRVVDANPYWVLTGEGEKRWSEFRESGYIEGARDVTREVLEALRRSAGSEVVRSEEGTGEGGGH